MKKKDVSKMFCRVKLIYRDRLAFETTSKICFREKLFYRHRPAFETTSKVYFREKWFYRYRLVFEKFQTVPIMLAVTVKKKHAIFLAIRKNCKLKNFEKIKKSVGGQNIFRSLSNFAYVFLIT